MIYYPIILAKIVNFPGDILKHSQGNALKGHPPSWLWGGWAEITALPPLMAVGSPISCLPGC